jgi:glycosyltransferase involved in cell wall biosynthesis
VDISIVVISKDEEQLDGTLDLLTKAEAESSKVDAPSVEVIVVDASEGRLAFIQERHPDVRWIDFIKPAGVGVSIPHQRNAGIEASRGKIIVFTDAGCMPEPGWLTALTSPIVSGEEQVTCGNTWSDKNLFSPEPGHGIPEYMSEAATINLAFTSQAAQSVGPFDESFEYGSDVDFTRRLVKAGFSIRYVPEAVVEHDWGTVRRQLKRARKYGAARVRLGAKHTPSPIEFMQAEPMTVAYALYLLGLPLAFRYRSYLLLLLIPLWRARKRKQPLLVVADHLAHGAGALPEFAKVVVGR